MADQRSRNPREPLDERNDEEQIRGIVDDEGDEFEDDDEDLDDEEDEESGTF
jgi:hypothetical protein